MPEMLHPYIERVPGICGGSAIIKGSRTPVRAIVGYYKMGMSVEDILDALPHLKACEVYDALSFYHDHTEELEQEIEENEDVVHWMTTCPPGKLRYERGQVVS